MIFGAFILTAISRAASIRPAAGGKHYQKRAAAALRDRKRFISYPELSVHEGRTSSDREENKIRDGRFILVHTEMDALPSIHKSQRHSQGRSLLACRA